MKRSVLAVVLMALLVVPSSALAQLEAAITRGACGSEDVALMLRTFAPSTAVENVAVSRTRVRSGLASLMERDLALTLLDDGSVVACGAIPASSVEPDRLEVDLEPTTAGDPYGYAILREFTTERTTIVVTVPGLPVSAPGPQEPQPAPTSTVANRPNFSEADLEYLDYLQTAMQSVAESSFRSKDLFLNPRIGQEDWSFDLASEFALWRALARDAHDQTPPPRFIDMHAKFTEMLDLLDGASYDLASGIDNLDPALMNQGNQKIQAATVILGELTDMTEAILVELGIEP